MLPSLRSVLVAGAGLVAADLLIENDVERYNALADEHKGFPIQTFKSSNITAPVFHVNTFNKSLIDESLYMFLGGTLKKVGGGGGPMIYSAADLSLIYLDDSWGPCWHSEPQLYKGEQHLTFYAAGPGQIHIFNQEYKEVKTVKSHKEMHEHQITPDNNVIFSTARGVDHDNTIFGGGKPGAENGRIHDSGFREVNPETGETVFEWWVYDHSNPEDTFARYEADDFGLDENLNGSWDISHLNGARKTKEGHYLVSNRNFCNIQLVNGTKEAEGAVIWTLGGKSNDFEDLSDGRATDMCWQHNARYWRDDPTQITMFDNHLESQGDCGDDCHARGLHVEIDTDAMTAKVVREYFHPGHVDSLAMGGMHKLDSGNAITAWGWTPSIVEYGPEGEIAMDIQRGKVGGWRMQDMFSYRVFKGEWTGRPTWPPAVVAEKSEDEKNKMRFYMSWNGATDIATWRIYSSDSPENITNPENLIGEVSRGGFETSMPVETHKVRKYAVVSALTKEGEVLGSSDPYQTDGKQQDQKPDNVQSGDVSEDKPDTKVDEKPASEAEHQDADTTDDKGNEEPPAEKEANVESDQTSHDLWTILPGLALMSLAAYCSLVLYRRFRHKVPRMGRIKYMPILSRE